MASQHAFDRIAGSDFEDILSQYPVVVPTKLADLEEERLSTIPNVLARRRAEGEAYMTKAEVATLVDWKLYVRKICACSSVNSFLMFLN